MLGYSKHYYVRAQNAFVFPLWDDSVVYELSVVIEESSIWASQIVNVNPVSAVLKHGVIARNWIILTSNKEKGRIYERAQKVAFWILVEVYF